LSEEAKPNSIAEQRVHYEAAHAQATARNAEPAQPDAEAAHTIEDENATSCASYAPPPMFRGCML
jgi:hypothetical protein